MKLTDAKFGGDLGGPLGVMANLLKKSDGQNFTIYNRILSYDRLN